MKSLAEIHCLTAAERKVLESLIASGREPVSRNALCEQALHRPLGCEDRSVDQIILALRRKLGTGGREVILSVRGAGYALAVQPEQWPLSAGRLSTILNDA